MAGPTDTGPASRTDPASHAGHVSRTEGVGRFTVWAGFLLAYVRANLQSALEYRISFATQVFAMMLNDAMWLVFWLAYFDTFQVVEGWGRNDIVTLWAVVACGFGVATTFCGNLFRIAGIIVRGELDIYLALPKPPLPHLLISRMSVSAPGDVLFGLAGFLWIVRPDVPEVLLFVTCVLTSASILTACGIVSQSLAFWLGNAEAVGEQFSNALISFSTYPTPIFRGAVKLAMFTILPAGFLAYVPVRLFQDFSWWLLFGLLAVAAGSLVLSTFVFRRGLKRYESGNLVLIRE